MSKTSDRSLRVLITGAGSGLGRAFALAYARQGARIACTDQNLETAEATLGMVQDAGGRGMILKLDVTEEQSFIAARDHMLASWGGIDILINNAGVAAAGDIDEVPIADWNWILDINLLGPVRGCKVFVPLLKKQKSGHIINIASFAGVANPPNMSAYNAAKSAVISLSETLRHEMHEFGVGVTVVCPAFFPTNLMNTARVQAPGTIGMVQKFMKKSGVTAESVVAQTLAAVKKREFMVLTHKDTRIQVAIKRAAPETFFKLVQKKRAQMRSKVR